MRFLHARVGHDREDAAVLPVEGDLRMDEVGEDAVFEGWLGAFFPPFFAPAACGVSRMQIPFRRNLFRCREWS